MRQRLEKDQVVVFHGPELITIRNIRIETTGDLRSALQGYWFDGAGGGCFSPLYHARRLEIQDSPQALQDLLAYAEGTYQLGGHWENHQLKSLSVEVDCSAGDLPVVEQLR